MTSQIRRFWLTMMLIGGLLSIAGLVVGCKPTSTPTPTPTLPQPFAYQVQVKGDDTGTGLEWAEVVIAVSGMAPLDGLTDARGLAIISVSAEYAGEDAVLTVQAAGYRTYTKNVTLVADALPNMVQLNRDSFDYQVQVQDKDSQKSVVGANVILATGGVMPLNSITDANGLAVITIPAAFINRQATLTVEATGYVKYTQSINLVAGALPNTIQIEQEPVTSFIFGMYVQEQGTGDSVMDARVVVSVDGMASLDGTTNEDGLTEILIPAEYAGQSADLAVQATGYGKHNERIILIVGTLPDVVELVPSATTPELTIADFDNCFNVNNLSGSMGAAYNSPDSLVETYVRESERGCVARLEYTIQGWSAFWMELKDVDLTPYSKLAFDIRADSAVGTPEQIKIELKRAGGQQVSIIYVSGITANWQTMDVSLADFGPTGYTTPLSSLMEMEELVFVFEASQSGKQGVVYLDNITFVP